MEKVGKCYLVKGILGIPVVDVSLGRPGEVTIYPDKVKIYPDKVKIYPDNL